MNFSKSLDCGACIRGGYEICLEEGLKLSECKEKIVDRGWCSHLFADKFNFLYGACPRRGPACEESKNDFEIKNYTDTAIGTYLTGTVGQSCTYHVKTKCGFPRVMINVTSNAEHFNVLYGLGDWNETNSGFDFTMHESTWFTQDNSNSVSLTN